MKPLIILAALLSLSAAYVSGQSTDKSPTSAKTSGKASGGKPGPATLRGCLQRYEGYYTLTDSTGTTHRLSDFGKLKQVLGHEVELTGKPTIRTIDTTPVGGASSAIEQHVFEVSTVQDIAGACQN